MYNTLLTYMGFSQNIPAPTHHLPALIYGFSGEKKNIKFYSPPTTEQNIARVNLFHKPCDSSILRAIDAIDAIFSDQVNP
jgi:hypothetical protein